MSEFPFGQGHGVYGRFAGLPDEFSDPMQSKIVILPVPFDLTTTYQRGTDCGPSALIEASRNMELYDIETNSEVYKNGIYTAPPLVVDNCEELQMNLIEKVSHFIKKKQFVVTVGGEHSISFAPIKAHLEHYSNLSVLQLDAHADLQDSYEGNPWSHACVMARVIELPLSSVVSVGIRSMSYEELKNLNLSHTFFSHKLDSSKEWMQHAVNLLSENVYITLDLDVFDSSIMPSTGTPEPGGLDWYQVTNLIRLVAAKKNIVGFDIVELCPSDANIAPDYLAAKLIYKILSYKFSKGAGKNEY
jgi:agmatinase